MSVKKYELTDNGVEVFSDGRYVIHSDYAALLARHNALEEALNEISTLYWVDAPAPEEMRRIARRALEEK